MRDLRLRPWWKYVTVAWVLLTIVTPTTAYAVQHVR